MYKYLILLFFLFACNSDDSGDPQPGTGNPQPGNSGGETQTATLRAFLLPQQFSGSFSGIRYVSHLCQSELDDNGIESDWVSALLFDDGSYYSKGSKNKSESRKLFEYLTGHNPYIIPVNGNEMNKVRFNEFVRHADYSELHRIPLVILPQEASVKIWIGAVLRYGRVTIASESGTCNRFTTSNNYYADGRGIRRDTKGWIINNVRNWHTDELTTVRQRRQECNEKARIICLYR